MNRFYIARHGETENNRAKRLSGWVDTALTEKGLEPTQVALEKLKTLPKIDAMYSSDMGRAFITAYVIARGLNFTDEIIRKSGLREVNYGDAANCQALKRIKNTRHSTATHTTRRRTANHSTTCKSVYSALSPK